MKKFIIILLFILMPFNVYAYSNRVILGGENIGINVSSDGILVVGFYEINDKINQSKLNVGDYIIKVGNTNVDSINELINEIDKQVDNNEVNISIRRNNKIIDKVLYLENNNNVYKTGLYVKDSITGNGTLTYIDPENNIYGALGHKIIEGNSNSKIEIKDGNIFRTSITSVTRSVDGNPGSINTKFYKSDTYGTINKNSNYGIFGSYFNTLDDSYYIDVGNISECHLGEAYIYTSIDSNKVGKYKINIIKIDRNTEYKNYYFEIVDKELIDVTGGVVQGMSGSPIVQDNKLIGAVTHVIVDDVLHGYGINIVTMLEEGDK